MAGYYDEEFIDKLETKLEIEGGESYVKRAAVGVADIIRDNKLAYKTFGVYWWAVKDAIIKYTENTGEWFYGVYNDELMRQNAWHGNEFRTILAAMYYHGNQLGYSSDHEWDDEMEVEHLYTLFDENAGL